MFKFTRAIGAAFAAVGLSFAAPAAAEPIMLDDSSVGESYTINFDGFVDGGSSLEGLGGQLNLTLQSIVDGVYTFAYSITNTGSTTDSVTSRLSGFAFNTDPDITAASSDGDFAFTSVSGNYPNGIGTVDVCFKGAKTGSCSGGGSGGVFDGATGTGTLTLAFATAPTTLTLDDFFVRYQSITGIDGVGSASGRQTSTTTSTGTSTGTSTTTTTTTTSGGTEVPAPGMLAIFAMALMALFGFNRRRKIESRPMVGGPVLAAA